MLKSQVQTLFSNVGNGCYKLPVYTESAKLEEKLQSSFFYRKTVNLPDFVALEDPRRL